MSSTPTSGHVSYSAPREVISGAGSSASVGGLLRQWGVQPGPVLVVRDAQVAALGLGDLLVAGLAEAGYRPSTFDGITTEPTFEIASAVLEQARVTGATAVVGMGGGSSMDMAKLAAAYAREPHSIDAIIADATLTTGALPLVLVPTTAGTGAEATRVSMLSVDGRKRILVHRFFMPLAAVLDPDLIATLPPAATAASGLDALSHAVESYVSTNATPLTESAGRSAIRMLATALPRAYESGSDTGARSQTLTAAHLAGCSLNAGVVLGHSIAYTIAARSHLPHGITAGMALPFALAYSLPVVRGRLSEIAGEVPGSPTAEGLLQWLLDLNRRLGVSTSLKEIGLAETELSSMAVECVRDFPRPNNPVPLQAERLERLLGFFYTGDLDGAVDAMAREEAR